MTSFDTDDRPEDMPLGFGLARIEETGSASHEFIYEHEYFPQPVWPYLETLPVASGAVLRPAVRNGKVDFQFFGNRVPLSADHARCWLGHALQAEVQKGRLVHVEFIVQRCEDLIELTVDGPSNPRQHGQQPAWLWDVWPAAAGTGDRRDGPAVEVLMRMSGVNGISIELFCTEEGPRAAAYRVLRQYCDEDHGEAAHWRPIPEPPARVSKVLDRKCSAVVQRRRVVGQSVPESGGTVLSRSLRDWGQAEARLVQAVGRAETARHSAGLRELMMYCIDVRDALEAASSVWLRLRPEWITPATMTLDTLLRRSVDAGDAAFLDEALAIMHVICDMGIEPPESLEDAEQAKAHFEKRLLGSSLALPEQPTP